MLYGAYGANLNMANMEVRCPLAKPILGFHLVDYNLSEMQEIISKNIIDHVELKPLYISNYY